MTYLTEPDLYREQSVTQQTATLLYATIRHYEGAVGRLLAAFVDTHGIAVKELPTHVCMGVTEHGALIAIPIDELVLECTLSEDFQPISFNKKVFLSILKSLPQWQEVQDILTSCLAFNRFACLSKARNPKMMLTADIRKALGALGRERMLALHQTPHENAWLQPCSLFEVAPHDHAILSYKH